MKYLKQRCFWFVLSVVGMALIGAGSSAASVIKSNGLGWAGSHNNGPSYIVIKAKPALGTASLKKVRVKGLGVFNNVQRYEVNPDSSKAAVFDNDKLTDLSGLTKIKSFFIVQLSDKKAKKLKKIETRLNRKGKKLVLKTNIKGPGIKATGMLNIQDFNNPPTSQTPEPTTLLILGSSIIGLAVLRKRTRK